MWFQTGEMLCLQERETFSTPLSQFTQSLAQAIFSHFHFRPRSHRNTFAIITIHVRKNGLALPRSCEVMGQQSS